MEPGEKYPLSVVYGGKQYRYTLMKSANIPSIHITLDEDEEGHKGLAYIHEAKGNELKGKFAMVSADGTGVLSEGLKKIKGRGNTSWAHSGENNITLKEKQELIPSAGAAKKWCLLSTGNASIICNLIGHNLYFAMHGVSALSVQPIDLYIDGDYRGLYLLTEKVEIDKERVDIKPSEYTVEGTESTEVTSETDPDDPAILAGIQKYGYTAGSVLEAGEAGGYLIERNNNADELCWFRTRHGEYFALKEPECATREQVQQIAIYVQQFEDALFSPTGYNTQRKHYSDYIDEESFIKLYLLDCFTLQGDMMCGSAYYYVDTDLHGVISTPLVSEPAWDYDYLFSMPDLLPICASLEWGAFGYVSFL